MCAQHGDVTRSPAVNLGCCVGAIGAALLLACAVAGSAVGQDAPAPCPPNVCVVVDRSASMAGDPIGAALAAAREIGSQPVDEFRFGVVAFNSDAERWPGDGDGWAEMPSADAVDRAGAWLAERRPAGNTNAWSGLDKATREVPDDGLLVVMVSDGRWQDAIVAETNVSARVAASTGDDGRLRLRVAGYHVGPGGPHPNMRELARVGRAWCWP